MMVVRVGEAAFIALQLLSRHKSKPTRPSTAEARSLNTCLYPFDGERGESVTPPRRAENAGGYEVHKKATRATTPTAIKAPVTRRVGVGLLQLQIALPSARPRA